MLAMYDFHDLKPRGGGRFVLRLFVAIGEPSLGEFVSHVVPRSAVHPFPRRGMARVPRRPSFVSISHKSELPSWR